jgi:serine/threonine-protein phosphatase 4 regulatory subunit 4
MRALLLASSMEIRNIHAKECLQVLGRVLRELAAGKAYGHRVAFTRVAAHVLAAFSSTFFAAHLLPACLACCFDPVPNVRLAMPALLTPMKRTIRLPDGVEQLERLNSAVSNLLTDVDRDVCAAARAAHPAFKAAAVRLSGVGLLDASTASKGCAHRLRCDRCLAVDP